jgi:hypothetical protein
MRYAKGIMWLDDCRIPFNADDKFDIRRYNEYHDTFSSYEDRGSAEGKYEVNEPNQQGRFTPNLLVCDDLLNDGVITQYNKTREDKGNYLGGHRKEYVGTTDNDIVKQIKGQFFSDKGSNSRYYDLDKWFDKVIGNL